MRIWPIAHCGSSREGWSVRSDQLGLVVYRAAGVLFQVVPNQSSNPFDYAVGGDGFWYIFVEKRSLEAVIPEPVNRPAIQEKTAPAPVKVSGLSKAESIFKKRAESWSDGDPWPGLNADWAAIKALDGCSGISRGTVEKWRKQYGSKWLRARGRPPINRQNKSPI